MSELKEVCGWLAAEAKVRNWWGDLQQERKCNSTNTISKIVNNLTPDEQHQIREVISQEIDKLISECISSKDLKTLQATSNAINGCFDNFVHAADAVRNSFEIVLIFINFGIEECTLMLSSNSVVNSMSKSLEQLHCLSRILVLVLKLKRPGKQKCDDEGINENMKAMLFKLGNNIGSFLLMSDVSMDSKNNFAMAAILIREITMSEEDLIQYHKNFVQTIPVSLEDSQYKLNILKFLLSSAIINTWSVNIIDANSTSVYLNFFIMLCEKYSKDTPVVLNTSRTLLLLIKNECFANYVNNLKSDDDYKTFELLLTCIWMLLEHPVSCVRNSAKDYLQVLVSFPKLQKYIVDSVFNLPKEKRSFYIGVASLANELGTRYLVENYEDLPKLLLIAVCDPTIVSHVSFALEKLILNDVLGDGDPSKWCELWIIPLLILLTTVLPIVAADIEKIIEKAFKKYPNAILHIIKKWDDPKTGEELRYVITALKISHKQGYKLKTNSEAGKEETQCQSAQALNSPGKKWKNLISENLLKICLHHGDDDIRMSAFSLIIEGHKTTEAYTAQDFELIQYFLRYNLNNQQPATRQKILGIMRKMLVRFTESGASLRKGGKSVAEKREKADYLVAYENFKNWLFEFCFSNIFPGANFNRLSTVLNILMLSFENIDNLEFSPGCVNYYWKKILTVLESSYEENKEMAVKISRKLDCSQLDANKPEHAKILYTKAFDYCSHMEPPDVLTGSYLLLVLLNLPCSKNVLKEFTSEDHAGHDEKFICIQILIKKLKEQVEFAKDNLLTASVTGPMYGTLFAVRLLLRSVDFKEVKIKTVAKSGEEEMESPQMASLEDWSKAVNELIDLSFKMTDIVSVVVNSSSPEGHLPMDFQSDFENLLSGTLNGIDEETEENGEDNEELPLYDGGADVSDDEINPKKSKTRIDFKFTQALRLVKNHSAVFINKLHGVEDMMKESDPNIEEIVMSLNNLFIDNKQLIRKWKQIKLGRKKYYKPNEAYYKNESVNDGCDDCNTLKLLNEKKKLIIRYLEKYGVNKKGSTSTAQVLLLCSWRSIKEASLYLGDLVSKVPIETAIELNLLTEERIISIGDKLRILLCEIKHRGAFEQAYIGFTQLITALWKCPITTLNELPNKWLEEIIQQLKSPSEEPKLKFCPTRRSAGLPFMVQAIIATEVQLTKSAVAHSLYNTMNGLLEIAENITEETTESRIHSLNILRALFKHAQLGECIAPYVSRALMVAIRGSRAATWSERNSSSLLFSSLMIRIFGVARSRDEISKKNRMTSRTFFQRYAELYDFLLSEVEMFCVQDQSNGYYPQPTLYLILLILGRLYPSPSEDIEKVDLSAFLPIINNSASNPTMKIRELGARALVSLISPDRLSEELDERFNTLGMKKNISQNERHGILLQIKALITETSELNAILRSEELQTKAKNWLENTKWFLDFDLKSKKHLSFIVMSAYTQVLHLLFKKCPQLKKPIEDIILDANLTKKMAKFPLPSDKKSVGVYLFLENFYYLKLDVTTVTWLDSNTHQNDKLCQLILTMLRSGINEVQALPLRLLRFLLKDVEDFDMDNDEDESFSAPIKDLLCLQEKNHETLRYHIFSYSLVKNYLAKATFEDKCPHFEERVIHRLWAQVSTMLLLKNAISISHSFGCSMHLDDLDVNFYTCLIAHKDKTLASYGIIGLGIYLMEEFEHSKNLKFFSMFCELLRRLFSPDNDMKCRMSVAKLFNRYCKNVIMFFSREPLMVQTCMIPVQLLVDDNPLVRKMMMKFVYLLLEYRSEHLAEKKGVMKKKQFDSENFNLTPLKAQEEVLDCLMYLFAEKHLIRDFVCQLLRLGLNSWIQSKKYKPIDEEKEEIEEEEEAGVFEKGNPNPFSEELAMTDLVCLKLNYINSILDMRKALVTEFTENSAESFHKFFSISQTDTSPHTILDIVDTLTRYIQMEDAASSVDNYCSIPRLQIQKIRKALEMEPINKNIKTTVGGFGEIFGATTF